MIQPPPQGPTAVSLLMQPSTSVSAGSAGSNGGSPSMQPNHNGRSMNSWEGDRMLHVYMIDYCRKRGYTPVVNALCATTGVPGDTPAPIDAPQGLLFEWWVVFWEIFTAKTDNDTKKNAVAYLQDQRARNFRHMQPTDTKPPIGLQMPGHNFNGPQPPPSSGSMMGPGPFNGPPGHPNHQQPPGMQPMPAPNGVLPPGQQQHPPQPPGAPTPVPPPAQHVNGPQPYPPQQPSQQPPHPNAANGPQGPPPPNQGGPGAPQPMNMANRPGGPGGPQMPMGAQRGPLGAGMQNGQMGHQPFVGSPMGPNAQAPGGPHPSPRTSQMGPPQGVRPHPQQPGQHPQQPGGPANAPTPGGSGMVNGMPSNQTPLMAAQQFMTSVRPGSRSGTPGSQAGAGGSQPGVGMSPSRAGGPPMQGGPQVRPGSQMGGPQQQQGGSPFTGPMPGPGGAVQYPPQMVEQAMKNVGLGGKSQESLTPEEKNAVGNMLRQMQGLRQPGMGTPRLASGGNPMNPGAPQPGPGGLQGGMPGNFQQQQPFPPQQQMMGQAGQPQMMKRPGSPMIEPTANESSPPDRKRPRKNSQNGGAPTTIPGFVSGPPMGVNGMPGQPQQPMQNGGINPAMMRPPLGAPGNPAQGMNPMMVNGAPHGPGVNPVSGFVESAYRVSRPNSDPILYSQMQIRGPQQIGGQPRHPLMQGKPGNLMANPHGPGLPIVKPEPGAMDMQQQVALGARGPQTKVQPSPSIPHAKAAGSMPPPSHTPNPSQPGNKTGVKDEQMDGPAKSSPGMKPAMQNPPTPVTNPATPQNVNLGASIFSSTIAPSPSAILAQQQAANMNQSTPPNASRPGSSVNQPANPTGNNAPFNFNSDMYQVDDFTGLLNYSFNDPMPRTDELGSMDESSLDFLNQFLNPSVTGIQDDDLAAAAGGSS